MQIRLTVLGPRPEPTGRTAACDVLVTAPAGTALATVASGLASAVAGVDGPAVLYAGAERLDAQRCTLGEPPLVDGAVLALGAPADPGPEFEGATAQLHVVAGPDAGGVHLLHGGRIDIGRSADADVPLDDPDVSRLHCAVTVAADGGVSVTDLGSTNGTTVNGTPIGDRPVRLQPGALLRLGESAIRLAPMGDTAPTLPTTPDGEGHLRVRRAAGTPPAGGDPHAAHARVADGQPAQIRAGGRAEAGVKGEPGPSGETHHAYGTGTRDRDPGAVDGGPAAYGEGSAGAWTRAYERDAAGTDRARRAPDGPESDRARRAPDGSGSDRRQSGSPRADGGHGAYAPEPAGSDPSDGTRDVSGAGTGLGLGSHQADATWSDRGASAYPSSAAMSDGSGRSPAGPDESGSGTAARQERALGRTDAGAGRGGLLGPGGRQGSVGTGRGTDTDAGRDTDTNAEVLPVVPEQGRMPDERARMGTPTRGTTVPRGLRRRGGFTAWARRLGRGRDDHGRSSGRADGTSPQEWTPAGSTAPEPWPDPAALLLTALGPGPRLWEREPDHPEALVVRLGTADRPAPGGAGLLPAVPVTVGLRESGALGLAGPRERLAGLARSVIAQLAALHSPDVLEIVLISTDRARPVQERTAEWSWLGWLPHLRPGQGQDCRLLLAFDREQAAARTDELLRRLDDHLREQREQRTAGPLGTGRHARQGTPSWAGGAQPPSWASGAQDAHERPGSSAGGDTGWSGGSGPPEHDHDPAQDAHGRSALHDETRPGGASGAPPGYDEHDDHGGRSHRAYGHVREEQGHGAYGHTPRSGGGAAVGRPEDGSWRAAAGRGATEAAEAPAEPADGRARPGPYTVVVVDGDPGSAGLREAVTRLAEQGGAAGIHVVCLAETPAASPASPLAETYEAACAESPAFRACGAAALLSGDVATALRLLRTVRGEIAGHGTVAAVDAVSAAWIERFARALAPLRMDGAPGDRHAGVAAPLPQAARLLDELGLARATPASLMARWAAADDSPEALGGRAWAVLGAGPRGPVCVDLAAEGPHMLIDGPPGSGRTELLRSVAASLAAAERPDRLGLVLIDGRDAGAGGSAPAATGGGGTGAAGRGDGLRACTDLPHVTTYLTANDPVRMREFAQSLTAELKRRAELLGRLGFTDWHTQREVSGRMVAQRSAAGARSPGRSEASTAPRATAGAPFAPQAPQTPSAFSGTSAHPSSLPPGTSLPPGASLPPGTEIPGSQPSGTSGTPGTPGTQTPGSPLPSQASGDLDTPPSSTLRLRPGGRKRPDPGPPLPRLVVIVDDVDALLSPALGSPGRPSAGSVVRALEAVARDGERLGVHLVAATRGGARPPETELGRSATLRIALDAPSGGVDDPAPGRGTLRTADGRATPFQAGRVTGRIPRTGTLRPTVVALDWERMGDPPARRPVRELGNGPTDLALLASALERAARSVEATQVPSLL
ncbi:FHA domain-containing protein [Streptomyces jeddahensis]|uniref:FtsK/SpoIIIE family protein n=1 Tax=Streptomyces jeddahensis TaxID=1716141 RepID=A0A177HGS5_9ACTN|nr:FHA domain-containing protein [Streptomyces jeddahensis]OAH10121.1 FtsK/SpoIIIE family protein [Streptomyces jeddahensis]